MRETFEKVEFDGAESVAPKLYKRAYLAAGKRKVRYYAIFTDWQHIRRKVSLGGNFRAAVGKIYELNRKNDNEVDFAEQKKKREARGMTLAKFVQGSNVILKSPWHKPPLLSFFGGKPIASIDDDTVSAYREQREKQCIIKHKKE